MTPVLTAESIILASVTPLCPSQDLDLVPLSQAAGRILAGAIASGLDFPHWDNSAMDGYAVRFQDVVAASPAYPATLRIISEIPAGSTPDITLKPGQAARILTGSMMPIGADTVVMQEKAERIGADTVRLIEAPPELGHFVRHRGSFYRSGDRLLGSGMTIGGAELAVLAAAQVLTVPVFRRVRVGVLSTGNELIQPHETLQPGQIVDSNQVALVALLQQAGVDAVALGQVRDDRLALKSAMAAAIESCDVVISSGGVSVGDYDYVEDLLEELGGKILVRSIAIKPGKPLTFATFGDRLYFGLPGNPVSALVTFWRFVLPAIKKRSGQANNWGPHWQTAVSATPLKSDGKRESYLWGCVHQSGATPMFEVAAGSGSSGNLVNLAGSNGLAVIPIGIQTIEPGTPFQVMGLPG
jgi:molybdopterin molybdotransferase